MTDILKNCSATMSASGVFNKDVIDTELFPSSLLADLDLENCQTAFNPPLSVRQVLSDPKKVN